MHDIICMYMCTLMNIRQYIIIHSKGKKKITKNQTIIYEVSVDCKFILFSYDAVPNEWIR